MKPLTIENPTAEQQSMIDALEREQMILSLLGLPIHADSINRVDCDRAREREHLRLACTVSTMRIAALHSALLISEEMKSDDEAPRGDEDRAIRGAIGKAIEDGVLSGMSSLLTTPAVAGYDFGEVWSGAYRTAREIEGSTMLEAIHVAAAAGEDYARALITVDAAALREAPAVDA